MTKGNKFDLEMRLVSFQEAFNYSPWPARITGLKKWVKTNRNIKVVNDEYDQNWYNKLVNDWESFCSVHTNPGFPEVIKFYNYIDRELNAEVGRNKKIYESTVNEYLVSAGSQLYISDLNAATAYHDWLVDYQLEKAQKVRPFRNIVELGCGNCKHPFRYMVNLLLDQVIGGEISSNAIKLGNTIASDIRAHLRFEDFNYYDSESYKSLTEGLKDYAVVTNHSIEQIPKINELFVKSLLDLPEPPNLVVHFEPVIFDEDQSRFSQLCKKYATINQYNVDLWKELKTYEKNNLIEIIKCEKNVFGFSAFNPTTVILWKPR